MRNVDAIKYALLATSALYDQAVGDKLEYKVVQDRREPSLDLVVLPRKERGGLLLVYIGLPYENARPGVDVWDTAPCRAFREQRRYRADAPDIEALVAILGLDGFVDTLRGREDSSLSNGRIITAFDAETRLETTWMKQPDQLPIWMKN